MGDENWDNDIISEAVGSYSQPNFNFTSKGRGISAPPEDDGWNDNTPSNDYAPGRGNSRGDGFRGGRGGGFRGDRGGGGDRNGEDWTCSCGVSNYASRYKCFKCSEPKPNDGGGGGFRGGRGGGGGGDRNGSRPGDWTCSCGVSNFASRSECFKCSESKPENSNGNGGFSNSYSNGGSRGYGNSNGGGDEDKWPCSCGALNFPSRRQCYKCKEDKPAGVGGGRSGGGDGGRPGDWKCSCGQSNFAKREECFKCSEPKPEGAGQTENGSSNEPFDRSKPPLYVPKDYDETEDNVFSSGIQSGLNFSQWENVDVKVSGENPPKPISSFDYGGLRPILVENLRKSKYTKPTPIQKYAIPVVLDGRDLMGCAQTGSGKTAAFLIPIFHKLLEDPGETVTGPCVEPEVIICAPTRELVIQIFEVAKKYAYSTVLKVCMHYGGASSSYFNRQLEKGCNVLVATMGRLKDILDKGRIKLSSVRFVVLDEADRMLDMGFLPDIQSLMQHSTMPDVQCRQTLMFSATFPESIQKLASQFMKNYIFVAVGIVGGACKDVAQTVLEVSRKEKKAKIMEVLSQDNEPGVIIFVATTRNADYLAVFLCESHIPTTSIHGQREQYQRELAIKDFKNQNKRVLVATGVASRGLDIKGVRHVINYDMPNEIDEYVHRIGRTGRLGNSGKATTFFDPESDSKLADDLVRILKQADQPVPDFLQNSSSGRGGYGGSDGFGARDIRNDVGIGQPQYAATEAADENWD